MQSVLTPEVLVPVGAGAVLLLVALIAVLVVRRRRRRRAQAGATVADAVRGAAAPDGPVPADAPESRPVPADVARPPLAEPGADATERVGSGRTVAAAVAQALAVREARARIAAGPSDPDGPRSRETAPSADPQHDEPEPPAPLVWPEPAPQGRGDARDRLLAVLLDDPVRAVGAAVELEACRRQLDRLTDAVRHEREALGSVLSRLAEAGLAPDQLARLSGLSDEELRSLLPDRVGA